MSNEKTNVQSERKDYPILEKMKNLPGGLVIIPLVIAVVIQHLFHSSSRSVDM